MHSCYKGRVELVLEVAPYRIDRCTRVAYCGRVAEGTLMGSRLGLPGSEPAMRLDLAPDENLAQLVSHYQKRQDHLPLEPALGLLRPVVQISTRRT